MAKKLNTAQRLLESIGVATVPDPKQAHGAKNASATKAGVGRYHGGGNEGNRITKPRKTRAYVALLAAWAAKRITKAELRDEHGAYTLVGKARTVLHTLSDPVYGEELVEEQLPRRKWLAGISAQRGY